jgi:hypothetical protein
MMRGNDYNGAKCGETAVKNGTLYARYYKPGSMGCNEGSDFSGKSDQGFRLVCCCMSDGNCLVQWAEILGEGVGEERSVAAISSGRPVGEGDVVQVHDSRGCVSHHLRDSLFDYVLFLMK